VDEAAEAGRAIELALALRPDGCMLDNRLPGSGIRAARELSERLPGTAVVMASVDSFRR
jgi:DNA-binding NarL/FixJ family response regulator